MTPQDVIRTVVLTNDYRRWRYMRSVHTMVLLLSLLALSMLAGLMVSGRPTVVQVFQADVLGRLKDPIPLDRPNVGDDVLLSWATEAVTRVFTFDFANYREQMQSNSRYMTQGGWEGFQAGLQEAGNFDSIIRNKYVVTAAPAGPAVIVNKGPVPIPGGLGYRFGWTVEIPIVVTYQSSEREIAKRLSITALVGRMPEQGTGGSGLGIRQVIAK